MPDVCTCILSVALRIAELEQALIKAMKDTHVQILKNDYYESEE